ncbi:uncharacterized protein KY384_007168 [Bacidia gigantensis]|uniref:uncharacterized protein n=1 Tax=Bacidia gigantensis TaxID=2732470 RepID=UPI001D050D56|nr:uncharacterized protein KY384_007168 [Bacidia gigantensis]KAG8528251.1 hypothetical protein KY384_007168 [Bacidia gigantensis]
MAAATLSALIDPTKSGKYPIIIGEDLLRDERPRKRQRFSVQYNHTPVNLKGQAATVKASSIDGEGDNYDLSISNEREAGRYIYRGVQKPLDSFALVYDSAKSSFILERLEAGFYFNLRSTPSNKDASRQHPQLETSSPAEGDDNLFGSDQDDQNPDELPPDPNNPYDYRHFFHPAANSSPQPSRISSPMPNHTFASSPLLRATSPIQRPRSVTEPKKPSKPQQRYLSPNPREEADADGEDSDPNELVIDMGDSAPRNSRPWRSALNALNEGGRSSGPISFRSAASSMSPSIRGESDHERDTKGDQDVEEIDLGEPADDTAGAKDTSANDNGWDKEGDDLFEAELEQALEEQQAEKEQNELQSIQQQNVAAESSEESEEE